MGENKGTSGKNLTGFKFYYRKLSAEAKAEMAEKIWDGKISTLHFKLNNPGGLLATELPKVLAFFKAYLNEELDHEDLMARVEVSYTLIKQEA
jgi:hypothetical protein